MASVIVLTLFHAITDCSRLVPPFELLGQELRGLRVLLYTLFMYGCKYAKVQCCKSVLPVFSLVQATLAIWKTIGQVSEGQDMDLFCGVMHEGCSTKMYARLKFLSLPYLPLSISPTLSFHSLSFVPLSFSVSLHAE